MSRKTVGSRRSAIAFSMLSLLLTLLGSGCGSTSTLPKPSPSPPIFPQTKLNGDCLPKYAVSLPVFGPSGSIPRVNAASHPNLTVTMKEINQSVLPQGSFAGCGAGVTLGETRVWAYQTTDSDTGAMLGPAHWPAVTIVAQRGTTTRAQYVNQLPSFNPSNPSGPGLVQGLLPFDQTVHWADPLQGGCGMQMTYSQSSHSTTASGHDKWMDFPNFKLPEAAHLRQASYSIPSLKPSSMPPSRPMGHPKSSSTARDTASDPCKQPYYGPVPATVHLHGAELAAAFDGDPESWFTPNGLKGSDYHTIGNPGPGQAIYEYPNSQEAGTLWFHDHSLGNTRLNVYAGLAGFYFIKDPDREPQGYPSGPYEIEMAIQDRSFDTNGQLYFPQQLEVDSHPFWAPIFEGDVATVNGAAFPYLNVEPRRYRFHLLNGNNHRPYQFVFGGAPVYLIGSDDNYFDQPILLPTTDGVAYLSLLPGERTDIIIDFSKFAGQKIELTNIAGGTYFPLKQIMQFQVGSTLKTPETSCDPTSPDMSTGLCARQRPLVRLTDGKGNVLPGVKVDRVRQMVFYDYVVPGNGHAADVKEYVNNTTWNGQESPNIAYSFPSDGISELPRVGSIEEWDIAYLSTMKMADHPVHLHLSQFQVLNRQTFNATTYLQAWNAEFGNPKNKDTTAPLPASCSKGAGNYCPDYGPPLNYLIPNSDGALGGNLGFKDYVSGDIMAPDAWESGWKDTARLDSNQVIRILVRWTPSDIPVTPSQSYAGTNFYEFDPTLGYYVWHCHILNHEDNEMMRPYRVTK